jgi:hypothetical protein
MDARFEVIDALVDGERVEPQELERALSQREGRDYMIATWLLRESVQDEIALEPPAAMPMAPARRWAGRLMVAAVAAFCLASGYLVGHRMAGPSAPEAATSPSATNAIAPASSSAPAVPAPTRVIHLQPGVDWKEGTGGG